MLRPAVLLAAVTVAVAGPVQAQAHMAQHHPRGAKINVTGTIVHPLCRLAHQQGVAMRICLPAILLLVVASPVRGHSQCQLTGVWESVSGKVDGQPYPTGLHQQKFITRSHWAWVLRQDTDLKDLKTVADTLAAYRTRA